MTVKIFAAKQPVSFAETRSVLYAFGKSSIVCDSPGALPYTSWVDRDIIFTVTDAGGNILREFQNTFTDPSFGDEDAMTTMSGGGTFLLGGGVLSGGVVFAGPPAPKSSPAMQPWTIKEAWDMYYFNFG